MIYIITRGIYSDYGIEGIVEGPAGLGDDQAHAAYQVFARQRDEWLETKWATIGPRPYREDAEKLKMWEADFDEYNKRHPPMESLAEVFVRLNPGCRVLEYTEAYSGDH